MGARSRTCARCINKERTVNEPPPPVPFTQQLLEQANSYRQQARDLRAQPNILANPPPNLEAERLDALATELVTQAIATDASNESARVKANLDKWVGDHKAIADWHNENTKSLILMSQSTCNSFSLHYTVGISRKRTIVWLGDIDS